MFGSFFPSFFSLEIFIKLNFRFERCLKNKNKSPFQLSTSSNQTEAVRQQWSSEQISRGVRGALRHNTYWVCDCLSGSCFLVQTVQQVQRADQWHSPAIARSAPGYLWKQRGGGYFLRFVYWWILKILFDLILKTNSVCSYPPLCACRVTQYCH